MVRMKTWASGGERVGSAGLLWAAALLWCIGGSAHAQLGTRPAPRTDCRVKPQDLKPMIDSRNPFFCNHFWNDAEKTEIAQLDPDRFVAISQEACIRHHVKVKLTLTKELVKGRQEDIKFFLDEATTTLARLYLNDLDFANYRFEFERLLTEQLIAKGLNRKFDFHFADRTFVCQFEAGDWGAAMQIELVRIWHAEAIRLPGIKAYLDDAHARAVPFTR